MSINQRTPEPNQQEHEHHEDIKVEQDVILPEDWKEINDLKSPDIFNTVITAMCLVILGLIVYRYFIK